MGMTQVSKQGAVGGINMGPACSALPLIPFPSEGRNPQTALSEVPLTWKAMVPAALHVQSRQVQPDPSHLPKQLVPEFIYHHGILPV